MSRPTMQASPTKANITAMMVAVRACSFAALFVAVLVAGCSAPYTVHLASADERLPKPRFAIIQHDRPEGARYYRIDLWDRETGVRSWRALSSALAQRPSPLVYGEVEGEWTVETGPTPLKEGKRYILQVVGEGDGNLHFRVEPGGRLVEDQ